jgi:hypothetical protein
MASARNSDVSSGPFPAIRLVIDASVHRKTGLVRRNNCGK